MAFKKVQSQAVTLYASIAGSDTSMRVTPHPVDLDGNKLTMAALGATPQVTVDPKIFEYEEIIGFTGITDNGDDSATLTGLSRDLASSSLATPGTGKQHGAGANVVISWNPQDVARLAALENDNTYTGENVFELAPQSEEDPVDNNDLARKSWITALVLGTLTTINLIIPGTAGDTITAGQGIYLNTATNRWNLWDADTASTVNNVLLGIAQSNSTNGVAFADGVLLQGVDDHQSGLTGGVIQYASNTAGGLSTSPGTTEVTVGAAKSATELYFAPRFNQMLTEDQQDALAGTSGTPSGSNPYVTSEDVSAAGVSGKIVRLSGTSYPAGDGSALTNIVASPAMTGIASGENITAGQPVYIDPPSSTVYKAHGFKEINSVSTYSFPTTFVGRMAKLSDSQSLVLGHNTTTTLTVYVLTRSTGATVDSEVVTTAFDQNDSPSTAKFPSATVCRLTDTTFIVLYAKTTDNHLYFRTGSISGSTITMDTETAYPGTPDWCFGFESYPGTSDGKVVFAYYDGNTYPGNTSAAFVPKLSYLTVTTNSVTVTTSVSGGSIGSASYNSTPTWTAVTFTNGIAYALFCCVDGNNIRRIKYNWINTHDSSTGADIETLNLESQTGTGVPSVYSQYLPSFIGHNGKAYFGWATNNVTNLVNTKTVLEINQIGCKCIYQYTTVRLAGDDGEYALPMVGNECGVVVFDFPTTESGSTLLNAIYIQKDKVYEFPMTSSTTYLPTPGIAYSNLKDEVVFGNDGSFLRTWRLPTPVDGMAVASVTSPAAPTIYTQKMTTSGLTANAQYFLKDTYTTTGDMAFQGVIPVGQALSTTVMKIIPS